MRQRHKNVVDAFLVELQTLDPSDPASVAAAKARAIEKAGYGGTRVQSLEARKKAFENIWRHPTTTQYLAELWGVTVREEPIGRYARRLDEIIMQPRWKEKDPKLALSAIKFALTTLLPPKVARLQAEHLHGQLSDPPPGFDDSPKMVSTPVISPEQRAARLASDPPESSGDEGDDDDE